MFDNCIHYGDFVGLYPVEFDIGIYVAFGVIFLLIIEAVIIIFKIASIYKRISENEATLGFIALQLTRTCCKHSITSRMCINASNSL